MNDKLRKFMEAVSADENLLAELKEKLGNTAGKNPFAVSADFAKEKGFELEEADFAPQEGELDPDELTTVTGGSGGGCGCAVYGYGSNNDDFYCACIPAGFGGFGPTCIFDGDASTSFGHAHIDIGSDGGCVCMAAGAGATNRG